MYILKDTSYPYHESRYYDGGIEGREYTTVSLDYAKTFEKRADAIEVASKIRNETGKRVTIEEV